MIYKGKAAARHGAPIRWLLLIATLVISASSGAVADTIRPVETPLDALANTAAIVEGMVKENSYTFDDKAGPRTVAPLVDVTTDFGRFEERTLELATLGGPINEKQELYVPELPQLTDDTRYLVFLTNVDWFFSPVVESYVFRLEKGPRGTDVLIAPSGHAVEGLTADGLEFTDEPVVDEQVDASRPNVKPRPVENAAELLANAMSKDDFLAAVRDLLRTVPLQGEFRGSPARDRVWNQISTNPAPLR